MLTGMDGKCDVLSPFANKSIPDKCEQIIQCGVFVCSEHPKHVDICLRNIHYLLKCTYFCNLNAISDVTVVFVCLFVSLNK